MFEAGCVDEEVRVVDGERFAKARMCPQPAREAESFRGLELEILAGVVVLVEAPAVASRRAGELGEDRCEFFRGRERCLALAKRRGNSSNGSVGARGAANNGVECDVREALRQHMAWAIKNGLVKMVPLMTPLWKTTPWRPS